MKREGLVALLLLTGFMYYYMLAVSYGNYGTANQEIRDGGRILIVSLDGEGDFKSIQEAVSKAKPGDRIVIKPGTYKESVKITKPYLTIIGTDREGVIIDGENRFENGFYIYGSKNVTIMNLTVTRFKENGIYYVESDYFKVVNVTVRDNLVYGIYATHSRNGIIAYSEASGSGDSGFYIGEIFNCNCTLDHVVAYNNVIGFSGTRSTHVTIKNSLFYNNSVGIIPNTLVPDIAHMLFEHGFLTEAIWASNYVIESNIIEYNNNRMVNPVGWTASYGVPIGTGIALAGATFNVIRDNVIKGHERWAIAEFLFLVPSIGNVFDNNILEDNELNYWGDGWSLTTCWRDEGKEKCDFHIPNLLGHIELVINSEVPGIRDVIKKEVFDSSLYLLSMVGITFVIAISIFSSKRKLSPLVYQGKLLKRRIAATILDGLLVIILYGSIMTLLLSSLMGLSRVTEAFDILLTFSLTFPPLTHVLVIFLWFVYSSILEGLSGRTPGKTLFKIAVVRTDGKECRLLRSFLRNLLRFLDGLFFYMFGLGVILVTSKGQRLGDKLSGTLVVPCTTKRG